MISNARARACALIIPLCLGGSAPAIAQGTYEELLARIPDGANVLMFADIAAIRKAPLVKEQGWLPAAGQGDGSDPGAPGLPDKVGAAVIASYLDTGSMNAAWEAGLLRYSGPPVDFKSLSKKLMGQFERIGDVPIAETIQGVYLFEISRDLIGILRPGSRQVMARWLPTAQKGGKPAPAFAKDALRELAGGAEVALVIDLDQSISPRKALDGIRDSRSLGQVRLDQSAAARAIASARSATFSMDLGDKAEGRIRIDFADAISILDPIGKDLVLTALDRAGVGLEDIKDWPASVQQASIVLHGPLKPESVRRILGLFSPPRPDSGAAIAADAPPASGSAAPAPSTPNAERTRAYYRAVVKTLDGLRASGQDYNRMAFWLEKDARAIDDMPILGVDPDVLAFGTRVSRALRDLSGSIKYSGQDIIYRVANMSGNSGGGTGYYGYGGYSSASGASANAIKRQERALLNTHYDGQMRELNNASADLRKAMTMKYGVEF